VPVPEPIEADPANAPALTGADRRHLRRLAHGLDPVVQVGASGVTRGVISALERALEDHELVKLRIAAEREERRAMASALASDTRSAVAGLVGHIAVLYRPARDPDNRRIALPSTGRSGPSGSTRREGPTR
jgi:RNA-binding protein